MEKSTRILFICSGVEPGKDGVGDYTLKLTNELLSLGCTVAILALNDSYVTEETSFLQTCNKGNFQIIRLPQNWKTANKFQRAKEWIKLLDPELISLQFVIFGYHAKGLPFGLAKWLKFLGEDRKWHIMFHELWVGMNEYAGKKMFLWGQVQKYLIKQILKELKPVLIHTHTRIYQLKLESMGFKTGYLPLCSNIVLTNQIPELVNDALEQGQTGHIIRLAIFGIIHPNAPVREFIKEVAAYSEKTGNKVILQLIGKIGAWKNEWVLTCNANGVEVDIIGEQTEHAISAILHRSSLGINTNTIYMAEKSSTIAAMREHGLNVICVNSPWKINCPEFSNPKGVFEYKSGNFADILRKPKTSTIYNRAEQGRILFAIIDNGKKTAVNNV